MLRHTEVRYEVTDNCNATCIMCPREKHDRQHGIMDQACFERSIDEVAKLGAESVVLTGFGEPLLDKRLEEKIRYAKTYALNTYIITNASALNEKRATSLLAAGLDEMRVSFYGMGANTYNAVMRGLDYEKTVKNILTFLYYRALIGAECKVQMSYLVLPENSKDVQRFVDYWKPKVDAVEVWKPHNFGDGKDYRERTDLKRTCGRPKNGPLQIQWDGTVIPCCFDYNNQIVLGNAFETPIMDILNGKRYRELRQAHESGNFAAFPYCDQCDQLLPHNDALIYSNRHNLPASEAVKLSNTDLYDLTGAHDIDPASLSENYK